MNPGKKIYAVLIVLTIASLILAACAPSDQVAAEEADLAEVIQEEAAAAQVLESQAVELAPIEEASSLVDQQLTAELTVVEGGLMLLKSGSDAFEVVEDDTIQVGTGDIIRTKVDGVAIITFQENTEATLFPNSQLQIGQFEEADNGVVSIVLQQFIGRTFHRANFPVVGSSYKVVTLAGFVTVLGTAFYTDVIYSALEGMTPEEIEAFINSVEFFQITFGSNPELLAELGEISASFDVSSGTVTFTYLDGGKSVTVPLEPGQTVTITRNVDEGEVQVLEDGTILVDSDQPGQIVIGVTTRNCGDSICDAYLGENAGTCSTDCIP